MRTGAALAALLIVPLLAGCSDRAGAPPVLPGLSPDELRAGGYYAFTHHGGPLVFTLGDEGDASLDLYGGSDERLGSVGFSSGRAGSSVYSIDGVAAGDLVVGVLTLNGTLRVESDGRVVAAFRALGVLVERHVLVNNAPRAFSLGGFAGLGIDPTAEPVDKPSFPVTLQRTPTHLRILGTGPWTDLDVQVASDKGIVLAASSPSQAGGLSTGGSAPLQPVDAVVTPQNIRDGALDVEVHAADLGGVLLIEGRSYSRAPLPAPAPEGPAVAQVAFTYGQLPERPVLFTVHPDATRLFLWQEDPAALDAFVALFDGDDQRIATVPVPGNGTAEVAIPAGGGDFVAVLLAGKATLGADASPANFDLHPLEETTADLPTAAAGSGGTYGQGNETVAAPQAFALRSTNLTDGNGGGLDGSPDPFTCGSATGRLLRVDQGGEALLVALETVGGSDAFDDAPFRAGTRALTSGPLTVTHDGFGADSCSRPGVAVVSYLRP